MSDYLDKIQTQKKDGTPIATVPFRDSAAREDITTIQNELTTDESTIEGNPINFSTLSAQKSKSTIIDIEPIQDLHGFDKPWVGGAGVNLAGITKSAYSTSGISITPEYDIDENFIDLKIVADGTKATETFYWITDNDPGVWTPFLNKTLKVYTWGMVNGLTFEIGYKVNNGDILSYGCRYTNTDADGTLTITFGSSYYTLGYRIRVAANTVVNTTLRMMIVESSATVTSFSPYTNIAAISGRTEIGILGCGKNLLEGVENGTWATANQSKSAANNRARSTKLIKVESSTQYCISAKSSDSKTIQTIAQFYSDIGEDTFISETSGWENVSRSFTTPENCKYIAIIFRTSNNDNNPESYMSEVQLEKSNQATTYTPYTKSTDLTISLGQTVYGGTLDVENGVLVVDREIISDASLLSWYLYDNAHNIFAYGLSGKKPNVLNILSSWYETKTSSSVTSMDDFTIRGTVNDNNVFIRDTRYSDATTFKNSLSGMQMIYELATPITINLTPHTINLLKGVNNISTDGDKITLTYRDGKIATLGDLTSAVDSLDSKIDESKILTDTATGDKYILVVTNGVLSIQQINE